MHSQLIALLILSPLIGFLINGSLRNRISGKLPGMIASAAALIAFGASISLWTKLASLAPDLRRLEASYFKWVAIDNLSIDAGFAVDQLSAIMILIITGVGSLIHLFSVAYMEEDETPAKYFAYLNLFLFNMLLLVLGKNLIVMFVGWEGVGLCSYLLIGYWFKDAEKSAAGMKAFLANRIGDAGLLLGGFILFAVFGTLDFDRIQAVAATLSIETQMGLLTGACLLLFLGATGKSAQIPLYVWLPDAMAGPTPVSALIHAATMVTAGVYMIVRLNALFLLAPIAMSVIAVVGILTVILAATIGMAQFDIKKILAYSTVSQLGYMFVAVGVGAFNAAMFHLMTHAFFKALMFLGSGSVIHGMHHEQDTRKMGGLKKYMPMTYATFVCGWLAILGTPLFSGFFSKDEILWMAFHSPRGHWVLWLLGVIGAMTTAFYMTRLMALTFWGEGRFKKGHEPHESPALMTVPLIILAVLSIVGGWIGIPHVLGHPLHLPNVLEHWLEPLISPVPGMTHGAPMVELALMGISVSLAGLSAYAAYHMYVVEPSLPGELTSKFKRLYSLVADKYRVDEFYFRNLINPLVDLARGLWGYIDVNLIDKMTYTISSATQSTGDSLRSIQGGNLQQYALYVVLGLVAMLVAIFT